MITPPQPMPQPAPVPEPEDVPYPGVIRLMVDATDVTRRIYQAHEVIPVPGPGPMTLLYPKWLPGFHAPQAPIELFAGLTIQANGREIAWKRHPVTVNAFHIDVPEGAEGYCQTNRKLAQINVCGAVRACGGRERVWKLT